MKQITKEQAILIYDSGIWQDWSDEEKVRFQLYQNRLSMPFDEFHSALEVVLNRPVYSHEMFENLRAEFEGKQPAPTLDELINMIPADKRLIIKM